MGEPDILRAIFDKLVLDMIILYMNIGAVEVSIRKRNIENSSAKGFIR